MTEYDYSPDAVEKYYAKLDSVGRWVDRQAREAPGYGNPFVKPADGYEKEAGTTSYVPQVKNLSRSVSNTVDPHAANHARMYDANAYPRRHSRSQSVSNASTPTLVASHPQHSSGGSSHSHSQKHAYRSQSQTRSSTRSHSRPPPSRAQQHSQAYMYASQPPPPLPSHGVGTGQPHGASYPARSATLPAQQKHYASAPGQPVVMQHGRQTYVVVPPHGGYVEVRVRNAFSCSLVWERPADLILPCELRTCEL